MDLKPRVLEDRHVRLEPIAEAHREGLRAACNADQQIWTELYPFSWANEHFDPTWAKLVADQASGVSQPYAVLTGGGVVGLTTFYAIDSANGVVEIGGTYYRPDARGGATNPAAKRLMMAQAFDSGARRVVYRVDASTCVRGLRSRSSARSRKRSCDRTVSPGPAASATRCCSRSWRTSGRASAIGWTRVWPSRG